MLVLVQPCELTRWLSAWIVAPILRLGYRTETFPAMPRTRLARGDERIVSTIALASAESPRRSQRLVSSCAESILCNARSHGISSRAPDQKSLCH